MTNLLLRPLFFSSVPLTSPFSSASFALHGLKPADPSTETSYPIHSPLYQPFHPSKFLTLLSIPQTDLTTVGPPPFPASSSNRTPLGT